MNVSIKTALSNFTKGGAPCYMGRTLSNGTDHHSDIVHRTAVRCGGVDDAFVDCVIKTYFGQIGQSIAQGKRVESLYFTGGIAVHGMFDTSDAPWDPARHSFEAYLTPRGDLKDAASELTGVNVTKGANVAIKSVLQDRDGAEEGVIVLSEGLTELQLLLAGVGLLVDAEAADEGVFLLDAKTGEVVATGRVADVSATTLDCSFDPVEPGQYVLAVSSRNGMGASFGAAMAKKKVTVVRAAAGE